MLIGASVNSSTNRSRIPKTLVGCGSFCDEADLFSDIGVHPDPARRFSAIISKNGLHKGGNASNKGPGLLESI
jgi:hypothetical protein